MLRPCSLPYFLCFLLLSATAPTASALEGSLSDNQIITSDALGYDLQYRVYTPPGEHRDMPVLYVTDGQWYIQPGMLHVVLDELIADGTIEPVVAVFVDNRDPHNLQDNRRNAQFFCNDSYMEFYRSELLPHIESSYPVRADRRARTILGLSFGGLNSACFGLLAHDTFHGIAMQSPAIHPIPDMHGLWRGLPKKDLKIFLSTGTQRDNEGSTRRLHEILENKGYDMEYIEVDAGHDWKNWKPLLDDVAVTFYAKDPAE
ncbi:MAG: alpha/beta hydrolase-fold protein [Acidobacteriota bacterium]